ncbi:MAG: SulP family inorganic anion transporter [Gammaproteobacteria bacterium]|nr:SulP family inorganic anion transporter [Gammaproteobacteria bacterium]
MNKGFSPRRFLPIIAWGPHYGKGNFTDDAIAAIIVAIMLIPQALAYAMVAGLPPETGLYASMFGLAVYALFGTSNTLSVAPVAVISLMTAAALGKLSLDGSEQAVVAAMTLAFLSGGFLLLLGLLRLGFMANFLSHPVISAFITASAIIIGLSQLQHLLGISASGQNVIELLISLSQSFSDTNGITFGLGVGAILLIVWCKTGLRRGLLALGMNARIATTVSRSGPLLVAIIMASLAFLLRLDQQGVQLLGDVPRGLPALSAPDFSLDLVNSLLGSAVLISIIGYVESISVSQTLAARRREQIDLDQELVGLGASNIAVSFGGGFPITGGFSRSVVNFEAGAATPAAGLFTAILTAVVTLFLTPVYTGFPGFVWPQLSWWRFIH